VDVIGPVSRQMALNMSYAGNKFPEIKMAMPDKYLHYDQNDNYVEPG
jgi:hypothetical protein